MLEPSILDLIYISGMQYSSLYPTFDVDQSTAMQCVYICGIVLWLGKCHDIVLWYN